MLHAAMLGDPELGQIEDVATAMAIKEGCKRVSSELYVQQQCEQLMSGKPVNEVAVGIAAVGGYVACSSLGAGAIVAGLCAGAAAKVAEWLLADYTPQKRAEIIYRAARGDGKISALGDIYCQGKGYTCDRIWAANSMRDVSRHNLTLLGTPNVWTKPMDQAITVIVMAIAAAGIGDKHIGWYTQKRSVGDLPSPPRPTPSGISSGRTTASAGKQILTKQILTAGQTPTTPVPYPDGSITAWDAKRSAFRIAVPRSSLAGEMPLLVEVASSPTQPAGVPLVPLAQLENETGQRRWYRDWRTYAVLGGVVAVGAAGVVIVRRRRR